VVQIHSPRPFIPKQSEVDKGARSLGCARDFGWRLRRRQDASSSNPLAPTISFSGLNQFCGDRQRDSLLGRTRSIFLRLPSARYRQRPIPCDKK
jgi:hypothetical protein